MKLQLAIPMVLLVAVAALVPSAQAATVNGNFQVDFNVLAGGSCTFSYVGGLSGSYDSATPTPTEGGTSPNVTCSFGTNWAISYDQGQHADTGSSCLSPIRRANSGSSYLSYELYRDNARTLPLGCDPSNDLQGIGTGSAQNVGGIFYRIPAGQTPTATGVHTDTVVATLTF